MNGRNDSGGCRKSFSTAASSISIAPLGINRLSKLSGYLQGPFSSAHVHPILDNMTLIEYPDSAS